MLRSSGVRAYALKPGTSWDSPPVTILAVTEGKGVRSWSPYSPNLALSCAEGLRYDLAGALECPGRRDPWDITEAEKGESHVLLNSLLPRLWSPAHHTSTAHDAALGAPATLLWRKEGLGAGRTLRVLQSRLAGCSVGPLRVPLPVWLLLRTMDMKKEVGLASLSPYLSCLQFVLWGIPHAQDMSGYPGRWPVHAGEPHVHRVKVKAVISSLRHTAPR